MNGLPSGKRYEVIFCAIRITRHCASEACILDSLPSEKKLKLLLAQDDGKMTPLNYAFSFNYTDSLKCMFDCVPCDKKHEFLALQHLERKTVLHYCSNICNSPDNTLIFLWKLTSVVLIQDKERICVNIMKVMVALQIH